MNYKYYVTDMAPNGTQDLVITDKDYQVIEVIEEAVFGHGFSLQDDFGGIVFMGYGEFVGYEQSPEEDFLDLVGNDNVLPLNEISLEDVVESRACSPIHPHGLNVLRQLRKINPDWATEFRMGA